MKANIYLVFIFSMSYLSLCLFSQHVYRNVHRECPSKYRKNNRRYKSTELGNSEVLEILSEDCSQANNLTFLLIASH